MSRLMDRLRGKEPWHDNELSAWHSQHRDSNGGVWAIRPPCGYDTWKLYAPGCRFNINGFVISEPTAEYRAVGEAEDRDGVRLDQNRRWMQPWVEQVSGGQVVDMVEGWSAEYGLQSERGHEYIVYARVVTR